MLALPKTSDPPLPLPHQDSIINEGGVVFPAPECPQDLTFSDGLEKKKQNITLNIAGNTPPPYMPRPTAYTQQTTFTDSIIVTVFTMPEDSHNSKSISRKTFSCHGEECGPADLLSSHFLCERMLYPSSSPPFILHGPFVQSVEACEPLLSYAELVILK